MESANGKLFVWVEWEKSLDLIKLSSEIVPKAIGKGCDIFFVLLFVNRCLGNIS